MLQSQLSSGETTGADGLQSVQANGWPVFADRRSEIDENPAKSILGTPGPKCIAQEVKLNGLKLLLSVDVPAIDHLGFIRVKFQPAFLETTRKISPFVSPGFFVVLIEP